MEYSAFYGTLITVKSEKNTYLFIDGADRTRYIASLIKASRSYGPDCGKPAAAGLGYDSAQLLFTGGDETPLRHLVRTVHASYGKYRSCKGCRVYISGVSYIFLDGEENVARAARRIIDGFDYICTSFGSDGSGIHPGTVASKRKYSLSEISRGALSDIAVKYAGTASFEKFIAGASQAQKHLAALELRRRYNMTYSEIGRLFLCSSSTAYRIVNACE